jgi:GPH family glycoside/pentoside/hexuronide:cation symporter
MLAYMGGAIASIPLWLRLSKKVGKNRAWTTAMMVGTIGYTLSYTYDEGTWIRWIVLAVVVGSSTGCTMVLAPAISADVIDSDELETGTRREGAFVGVWSFLDKAAVGLAVFVGLQGLEAIGYVPNVEQSESVIEGMKFLYCLLPAALHLVALLVFQKFPITPQVHAGIRKELEARAAAGRTGFRE